MQGPQYLVTSQIVASGTRSVRRTTFRMGFATAFLTMSEILVLECGNRRILAWIRG